MIEDSLSKNTSSLKFPRIVLEIGYLTGLVLLPLLLGSVWLWQFSISVVLVSTLLLFYLVLSCRLSGPRGLWTSPLDRWIGVYLVCLALGSAFSKVPSISLVEVYKTLGVAVFFWTTYALAKDRSHVIRITIALTCIGSFLSMMGILQLLGGLPREWWHRSYLMSSSYVNHNHFAGFLVMVLPIGLGLAFSERKIAKKILWAFACVVMGTAFVFSLSRGGLLALSAALVFMLTILFMRGFIRSSAAPFFIFVALVIGSVTVLGVSPIEKRIQNIQNMTEEEELSLEYRLLTWQGSLKMIPSTILVGSGPGTFDSVFLKYRPEGFSSRPVHAHNDLLELLNDGGLLLFIPVCCILWTLFQKGIAILWQDDSRLRTCVGAGCLAAMVGILIHGFIDFNFHVNANWAYAAVAGGLLLALGPRETLEGRSHATLRFYVPVLLLISVMIGGLTLGRADYKYWEAKELLKLNDKPRAVAAVSQAIAIHPWNAEYFFLKGFIEASMVRRISTPDALNAVERIQKDFDHAIRLNRLEPYYEYHKARLLAPLNATAAPMVLVDLYHKAIAKDPHNPRLLYFCARDILNFDKKKNPLLRAAAENILKKVVEMDPGSSEEVYDILWKHEKNISKILAFHETAPSGLAGLIAFLEKEDLWKYHLKYYLKYLKIDKAENDRLLRETAWNDRSPEIYALKDFAHPGLDPINFDDQFHTKGELIRRIIFHNSLQRIVLYSKSSPSRGTYPMLAIKVDGQIQDVHYMDSEVYKNYYTVLRASPGEHQVSLSYLNDFKDQGVSGEDRNIWIKKIEIQEPT